MTDAEFSLDRISSLRFRPTKDADEFLSHLRNTLVSGERYRVARLAIARSLHEPGDPPLLERGTETASAIEGTHLFGDEKSVWACLIVQASSKPVHTSEAFRALVEAHWHRGAELLRQSYEGARGSDVEFAVHLAALAGPRQPGASGAAGVGGLAGEGPQGRVTVRFGEIALDTRSNTPVEVALNAPGVSPHIALMGRTRSGKTRTGLIMAERIAEQTNVPVLFIDPKGDFVRDGALVPVDDWGGATLASKIPGIEPLDVPGQPIPLDFLALPRTATDTEVAEIAIAFRDSFKKCIKSRGDVAMDGLRIAVDGLLHTLRERVSLDQIRDEIARANAQQGRKKDSVEAKLNELTSLRLFSPTLSPEQFFSRRWVVGLNRAGDESKRLVMFLLLDALANHLLSAANSQTDTSGHRRLRHMLVVDEAVEILRYRHAALSKLVRQSAAKGGLVMLLSQSPEDFDQEEDDFLAQVGTIGVFTSSAKSVTNLGAAYGRRMRPEDFSDRELPKGIALVKLPHREAQKVIAWR